MSRPEGKLWREAVRGVTPLPRRSPAPASPAPQPAGHATAMTAQLGGRQDAPARPGNGFAGIDRASVLRLKRGAYPIEARLDLHGMTRAEAHPALAAFIAASVAAGQRCVLVITGLGPNRDGVLRRAVPRWLAEAGFRQQILAIVPAQPRHGGEGALYLLLRRRR